MEDQITKILIIEDEIAVSRFLNQALTESGYEAKVLSTAVGAIEVVETFRPHLIVLDAMMPEMTGFEFLPILREKFDTPVMMLTALGQTKNKVLGLDSGADDYLPKPFALDEFFARIRALLRRNQLEQNELVLGPLHIDFRGRKVTIKGQNIFLSQTEYSIVESLAKNAGKPVSKTALLERIWDDGERGANVVEVYVHYLRNKLEPLCGQKIIHTVRGKGYLLSLDEWDASRS